MSDEPRLTDVLAALQGAEARADELERRAEKAEAEVLACQGDLSHLFDRRNYWKARASCLEAFLGKTLAFLPSAASGHGLRDRVIAALDDNCPDCSPATKETP